MRHPRLLLNHHPQCRQQFAYKYFPHWLNSRYAVHHPLQPGPEFLGKSGKGEFHDWMAEVDWSVGQIMATVRELGLDKNTMVIFTSDNGSVCKEGGSNAPLRGAKFTTWEGGVRVPAIFWWPEKILPGVTTDAVLSELDILPTVVKLAGGSAPADRKIDGFDIWPLLSGKTNQSPREALYFWLWGTLQGVRSGSWKLVIADQKQGVSNEEGNQEGGGDSSEGDKKKKKTKGEGKSDLVEASIEKPRLYNLDLDPGEKSDVADQHPEVISKMMEYVKIMEGDLGVEKSSKKGPAAPGIRRYEPLSTSKVLSGVGDDYK